MPGHTRSFSAAVLFAALLSLLLPLTAAAQIRFDLPAQPLAQALTTVGSLANINIYFDPATVDGLKSPALKAELTPNDALTRLLAGTRLHAVRVDDNTFRVVTQGESKRAQEARSPATGQVYPGPPPGSSATVHLASAGATSAASVGADDTRAATPDAANTGRTAKALDEVIVSAEKRDERLQDVPIPVTAISGEALNESNRLRLQDYYSEIPGLTASLNNSGAPNLAIRGVTTGDGTNPTVGIVVDDIPYGSSTSLGSGSAVPDIDPSDLARIEVLRGPQGTLYGASSIGGLLKFVTIDPSPQSLSGRIQAGLDSVHNGNELGYQVRGAANVPVSDTAAVRVSAFYRRDAGYINNVQTGEKGINRGNADGARLAFLWKPSDDFSVKLSALFQDNRTYGSPNVTIEPGLGDLQQDALRSSGGYNNKIEAYSVTITGKVGGFDLTSLTGYSINKTFLPQDLTPAFGTLTDLQFGVGSTLTLFEADTRKFTQELRLQTSFADRFDWLMGLFYTRETSPIIAPILAVDTTTVVPAGSWLENQTWASYAEYAAFTDLTIHFTDQFDIQLGGRESHNEQSYSQVEAGPYVTDFLAVPSPLVQPQVRTRDNSFTYLVTPRFKLSKDLMIYARLASGYRPGGPNTLSAVFNAPRSFAPDKTQNYEIGVKGNALDQMLSFDASLYRINWKGIQVLVIDPVSFASYTANGSRAKSQGVELSVNLKPLQGLTISAWTAWNTAVLTETFPAISSVYGSPGDRLPYASRFSGSLAAEEDFPITGSLTGLVGASVNYVGNRVGEFAPVATGSPQRQLYPGYAQTDLRAGVRYDTWAVNFFVNNIADIRGALNGGLNFFPSTAYNYIQPRTVGVFVAKTF